LGVGFICTIISDKKHHNTLHPNLIEKLMVIGNEAILTYTG